MKMRSVQAWKVQSEVYRYLTMILSGAFSLEYLVLPNQIVT